jgi:hypothetical protein
MSQEENQKEEDEDAKEAEVANLPEFKVLDEAMKDNNLGGYNWTVVTSAGWLVKLDEMWQADHHHYQTVRGPKYTLACVIYEGPRQQYHCQEPDMIWHIYLTERERKE